MLRRALSLVVIAWALGFVWFAMTLPQPHFGGKTDGAIALTGGKGRIARGLYALRVGWTPRMLVAGVDREVRPAEFAAEYRVSRALMSCCVTLDFESVDTRSNAREAARWVAANRMRSVRLITTDWHMRRAAFELSRRLPPEVTVIEDAVASEPAFATLFAEYNKLIARWLAARAE